MLFIHVGLHKTGTTSLQNTFYQNSKVLEGCSINYPSDQFLTMGCANHLRLSVDFFAAIDYLLSSQYDSQRDVLLSDENLCQVLPVIQSEKLYSYLSALETKFNGIKFIVTLRDEFPLMVSVVKEYIRGNPFPLNIADEFLAPYCDNLKTTSAIIRRYKTSSIRLEDCPSGSSWATFFCSEVFSQDVGLPQLRDNSSLSLSLKNYLASFFRSLSAAESGEPFYGPNATQLVGEAMAAINIDREFEFAVTRRLDDLISKSVEKFLLRPEYVSPYNLFSMRD